MTATPPADPDRITDYRPCVGIALIDGAGRLFVAKRLDQTAEAWQMPQGGIDPGESPRAAAFRELEEEIGTAKAELVEEMAGWVDYDLPRHLIGVALKGRYRGQTMKWFCLRFTGSEEEIDLATAHPEFSEWRWARAAEAMDLIVPFKRPVYARVFEAFRAHLA